MMKRFYTVLLLCFSATLFSMSPQQYQDCFASGELRPVDFSPANEQELEYTIMLVLEIEPEQDYVDPVAEYEPSAPEQRGAEDFECASNDYRQMQSDREEIRRQSELSDVGCRPFVSSRPRSSIPHPSFVSGFMYRDSGIWPFVALPDMSQDSEIARYKTEIERKNVETLTHEMQSVKSDLKGRSFLDRHNRYVLSRRLSFIVRSIRQNSALYYLFTIHNAGDLQSALFGSKLLKNVLEGREALTVNGQEVKLTEAKRSQIMQIARLVIERRADYQAERIKHPASRGNQLLFTSPLLNEIDLLFAKLPAQRSSSRGSAGKAEMEDPFIELLKAKVNIHPDVNVLVQNGLANLQLNEPLFKQYLDATVSALEGMQKEGLLVPDPATSLEVLKHGTKHYFKKLIPTNPLEQPEEYAANLLKYTALASIHTATGGVLLPVQVAAEVALKLHAIQSADTTRMTPEEFAEFVAEELVDITYQVAANKIASVVKDSGIPQGFVRMTREMLQGDPEAALAGG